MFGRSGRSDGGDTRTAVPSVARSGYGDDGYNRWDPGYRTPLDELRRNLAPLTDTLREYDARRGRLEREGGTLSDLAAVTSALNRTFSLGGRYRKQEVSLVRQVPLRAALYDVGEDDVRLDVRLLPTLMPVYYLCRVRWDTWSGYSLVVEDLYRSPGYALIDERFVRLMDGGHEAYYLRLSPFRAAVRAATHGDGERAERAADEVLHRVGRHVFQAAWHDDQRPGIVTAAKLNLVRFREAIELLYLCLSGELCELRSAVEGDVTAFFAEVYPQPAITAFLRRLPALDGDALSRVPTRAIPLYERLAAEFAQFLKTEVAWGHGRCRLPLYKLLFANFARLGEVASPLRSDPDVREAATHLEAASAAIAGEVLA